MSKLLKRLNDNQNKVADTNGIMKLQAWDYGVAQDLTNKQITATIANAGGFLFDIDLVSNGTEIDLDFKDSQLQKLTPDTYFLEIKVTDKDGDVSVFPTEGYATFTINKNLHATEGALVPQITFDTVLADVKKAIDDKVADYTSTIAKGDKGNTGPQGPAGKDAEMPVVGGRNLLRGTSEEFKTITTSGWGKSPTSKPSGRYSAGKYYASTYIENTTPVAMTLYVGVYADSKFLYNVSGEAIPAGQSGIISFTFDIQEGHRIGSAFVGFVGPQTESYTYKYKEMMVTHTTTDWTPAPEDIQSDITKRAIDTSVVHNTGDETVAGNKTYVGDSTYMGTNTFMDGVSLNGKNVVNGLTDTDWQSLSLNAGYGGSIKYRYHMGALYLGIDDLTGIQAGIDKPAGRIPNYTTSKYHRFPLIIAGKGSIIGTVSTNGTIYVGNVNGVTLSDSDKGYATVTVL